jgi:hypothetical protein
VYTIVGFEEMARAEARRRARVERAVQRLSIVAEADVVLAESGERCSFGGQNPLSVRITK